MQAMSPLSVEDGKTGLVVPQGFYRLIDRIMNSIADRNMCRRMGRQRESQAEREFDRTVS
jgi:hypothetical protein